MKNVCILVFLLILVISFPRVLAENCNNFDEKEKYEFKDINFRIGIRQDKDIKYFVILDENCNPIGDNVNKYFEVYLVDKISDLVLLSPENLNTVEEFKQFFIELKSIYSGFSTSNEIARSYVNYADEILPYVKATGKIVSALAVVVGWSELYRISKEIKSDEILTEAEIELFKEKFGYFSLTGVLSFVAINEEGAKRAIAILLQLSPSLKQTRVIELLNNWETKIVDYPIVNGMYQITAAGISDLVDMTPGLFGSVLIAVPAVALEKEMESHIAYRKGLIARFFESIFKWINSLF